MGRKSKLSIEEKVKLVRCCLPGEVSIREAARQMGVNQKTVSDWIAKYKSEGVNPFLGTEKTAYTVMIGSADSKRMLDAYIHYCMHKKSKEREVKFATLK